MRHAWRASTIAVVSKSGAVVVVTACDRYTTKKATFVLVCLYDYVPNSTMVHAMSPYHPFLTKSTGSEDAYTTHT